MAPPTALRSAWLAQGGLEQVQSRSSRRKEPARTSPRATRSCPASRFARTDRSSTKRPPLLSLRLLASALSVRWRFAALQNAETLS